MKKINFYKNSLFVIALFITNWMAAQISDESALEKYERGEYHESLKEYLELSRRYAVTYVYNHNIARCYLNLNLDRSMAIPYLKKAMLDEKASDSIYLFLGKAYFYGLKFDSALIYFDKYRELSRKPETKKEVERFIEMTNNAKELVQYPVDVKFENLGRRINTTDAELTPRVSNTEDLLVFSSKHYESYNIYVSKRKLDTDVWMKPKSAGAGINTYENEILAGAMPDAHTIFIHHLEHDAMQNILISKRENSKYKETSMLNNEILAGREEGACLSAKGDTLFFASNRAGGYGDFDLYYSLKLPNGKWGKPHNLGPTINTPYAENYPNLSLDGTTLYFASSGHNSMGGYDVFATYWNIKNYEWSIPDNLGYPINDVYDNTNIAFVDDARYAYLSAIRQGGVGDYDIYKLIFNDVDPQFLILKGTVAVADPSGVIPLKEVDDDISITVYDTELDEIHGRYAFNKKNASYVISLEPGSYELLVEGDSYITYRKFIRIKEKQYSIQKRVINIYLQKKQ